jgi:hypothetical protein
MDSEPRTITLSGGEVAIVDEADYALVSQHTWRLGEKGYAVAKICVDGKRLNVRMHRLIMGLRNGDPRHIDHRNRVRLDNRRNNLRICTIAENNRNVGVRSNSKSGYKGVSWNKQRGRWHSRIGANGKVIHLGYFDTAEQAHEAFVKAARELHKDFFCERNLKLTTGQMEARP